MCTLAIYIRQLPGFPLLLAANRDEFVDRPATAPTLLGERPRIVGGRDLRAGGTWLAASERGMVAGLLNRRTGTPPDPEKASRGDLPLRMLHTDSAGEALQVAGTLPADRYNPFNLLVADRSYAFVAQNQGGIMRLTELDDGVHVLTNLDLNDPTCPKVGRSQHLFTAVADAFDAHRDLRRLHTDLRALLSDHTVALDPREPDPLGSPCVHAGLFATRCSSLLFLDDAGRWQHWFADGPPCRLDYSPALAP